MSADDLGRDDAVPVYRWLMAVRGEGGAVVDETAFQCFPVATEGPASSLVALRKSGVRRVLGSVVWLRASGVDVRCVPGVSDGAGGFTPSRYLIEPR
jgi:hypothetical protein